MDIAIVFLIIACSSCSDLLYVRIERTKGATNWVGQDIGTPNPYSIQFVGKKRLLLTWALPHSLPIASEPIYLKIEVVYSDGTRDHFTHPIIKRVGSWNYTLTVDQSNQNLHIAAYNVTMIQGVKIIAQCRHKLYHHEIDLKSIEEQPQIIN